MKELPKGYSAEELKQSFLLPPLWDKLLSLDTRFQQSESLEERANLEKKIQETKEQIALLEPPKETTISRAKETKNA